MFIIAAIIKTIQGSSTVAIVTTCAITTPLIQSIGMTSELEKVIFRSEMSDTPMTKSGFALSTFSSAYHTGLYVDVVAEQDGSVDLTKPDFFEDENFECYVKLAEENGFFVDANCPWRLVLNLESPITQRKILNGRPKEEFDKFYYDVYTIIVGYDN